MKINGLNSQGISINYNTYKNNYVKNANNIKAKNDIIEISDIGRQMKNYSVNDLKIKDDSMVEEIKNKIKDGTYFIDSKLTAKSMLESMSGI